MSARREDGTVWVLAVTDLRPADRRAGNGLKYRTISYTLTEAGHRRVAGASSGGTMEPAAMGRRSFPANAGLTGPAKIWRVKCSVRRSFLGDTYKGPGR